MIGTALTNLTKIANLKICPFQDSQLYLVSVLTNPKDLLTKICLYKYLAKSPR